MILYNDTAHVRLFVIGFLVFFLMHVCKCLFSSDGVICLTLWCEFYAVNNTTHREPCVLTRKPPITSDSVTCNPVWSIHHQPRGPCIAWTNRTSW